MEQEKLKIDRPIIVEGKYDKITLSAVLDAHIIPTGGFSLFNRKEQMALIRRLGKEKGVIVLTDSDGAGKLIRAHISSALPREQIIHLYIPSLPGKEPRKKTASREGLLGVEGMSAERLREMFLPFAGDAAPRPQGRAVEKRDFYADGLSGGADAAARREALAEVLDLPRGMTANALLAAINLLYSYEEYRAALKKSKKNGEKQAPVCRET